MSVLNRALIGLGANLGDPIQQILDARALLSALPLVASCESSYLYVSSPVGYSDQPNFINCALALETSYDAVQLFAQMQSIETHLGRVRVQGNQNAPRMIDIDLLLFGDQTSDDPVLTIPHPRICERLFVMQPLADLGVDMKADENVDFSDQILHRLSISPQSKD